MSRFLLVLASAFFAQTALFAQLPNRAGQVWQEYPLGPLYPPAIVAAQSPPFGPPMPSPTVVDYIKRETGEAAWTGPDLAMIGSDGQKLYVYHTPAVQRKVAETLGRFFRPETQKLRFVMETHFLTLSDVYFEQVGLHINMAVTNGQSSGTPASDAPAPVEAEPEPPKPLYRDIRNPVAQYLRPIPGPDGRPVAAETPGAAVYWVAKEDIPKLQAAWAPFFEMAQGDTRSSVLRGPRVLAFNGQLGAILDTTEQPFVTDVVFPNGDGPPEPTLTILREGNSQCVFSLLSWDGRTVDSDVHVDFTKITRVDKTPLGPDSAKTLFEIQTPHTESLTISEKHLRWPADGMLVVFVGGIKRLSEGQVRRNVSTPLLNKIPYINRLFMTTAIGRETQTINGIITVRMVDPAEQTANTPFPAFPRR